MSIARRIAAVLVAAALPAPARTGSEPRPTFLTGVAPTLLGVGLALRTADVDDD